MIASKLLRPRKGQLFSEKQWRTFAGRLGLPQHELQIVRLVFEDAREHFMAGELGISGNTVHTHLKRVYSKPDVRSRVGQVLRIVRLYLAEFQEAKQPEPTRRLHRGARKAAR
jgi:DNA-binding CsgD family transcriptional regulator